jgi:hypothetical protein
MQQETNTTSRMNQADFIFFNEKIRFCESLRFICKDVENNISFLNRIMNKLITQIKVIEEEYNVDTIRNEGHFVNQSLENQMKLFYEEMKDLKEDVQSDLDSSLEALSVARDTYVYRLIQNINVMITMFNSCSN